MENKIKTNLKGNRVSFFKVEQSVVAYPKNKIGPSLRNIGADFKRAVVSYQPQGENPVLAGVQVLNHCTVRCTKHQSRALRGVLFKPSHVSRKSEKNYQLTVKSIQFITIAYISGKRGKNR